MKKLFLIRRVVGESMLPYFQPGHIVLGWRFGRIRQGDVVIMSHDGLDKLKRIHHIDGDKLYVLGDYLEFSTDSRKFGWVDRAHVAARVVWPFSL